jgi:hypothetical protein
LKGYCRGVCEKVKATFSPLSGGYYGLGYKKCSFCDVFIDYPGSRCPCCNNLLRSKPIFNKARRKLLEAQHVHYY